jgi:hypothetical protein
MMIFTGLRWPRVLGEFDPPFVVPAGMSILEGPDRHTHSMMTTTSGL